MRSRPPSRPVLHVKVAGNRRRSQSVEIIKDGKFIYKTEPDAYTAEFDYRRHGGNGGRKLVLRAGHPGGSEHGVVQPHLDPVSLTLESVRDSH